MYLYMLAQPLNASSAMLVTDLGMYMYLIPAPAKHWDSSVVTVYESIMPFTELLSEKPSSTVDPIVVRDPMEPSAWMPPIRVR